MWKKRILSFLLVISMLAGLCPTTVLATGEKNNVNVHFEGHKPVYLEAEGENVLKIARTEQMSKAYTVTVQVYDNSANYEEDYRIEYDGKAISKLEGATSIYDAFRDNGELSSNLPVDAAEQIVTYEESTETAGTASDSEMLKQLRELNVLAAEFDVTFKPGETSKELTIDVLDDNLSEYDESILITLLDNEGEVYEEGQILATIVDDEEDPTVHVEFDCEDVIQINEADDAVQMTFKRTGNLATGTNAILNRDGEPLGYVDFAPHQDTQVVLAVAGTYTLISDGNYTVGENVVVVEKTEKELPKGADPELDAVPAEYDALPVLRQASTPDWFPDWAKGVVGTVEDDEAIIVMGNGESLFERDESSTDGSYSYDSSKNEGKLDTGGGEKEGVVFARTKKTYDLTGIESIEGTMRVKNMDVGYGDVIFGVWNKKHKKIYNNSNNSTQNIKYTLESKYWGNQYIYYANKDLPGIWDQGWTGYITNGFKMNKRFYKITLADPLPLEFNGKSIAPTLTGNKTLELTFGDDKKIDLAYSMDSKYPVQLVGFEFLDNKNKDSEDYYLNQDYITFDRNFLKNYESSWSYTDADGMETFTIRPVLKKIPVDYVINQTNAGSIAIKSPADQNLYMGDTVVFTGNGTGDATLTAVAYQCRQSAGSEIQAYGTIGAIGSTVTFDIDTTEYGHYTFEGVFDAGAEQLIVNYANEESKKHGTLHTEGLVIDKDTYDISNYYPLMADANDGYVTEWNVNGKKFYGDTFNYQLTGLPSDNTIKVDFVKESSLSMTNGTISGYLTRANVNLFNGVSSDIVLANTSYVVTTSKGEHTGYTDENGYFEIKDFYGVNGGTYSIAANYQNRTGYVSFVYNGTGKQTIRFPQYPAGGFYPVEVTATVDGVGYKNKYIYLKSAGTAEIVADIYVHSDDYEITDVTFHFVSNLSESYGVTLKEHKAAYDPDIDLGGKHEAWKLMLNDTSQIPEDSRMYVTVTAKYPYTYVEEGVTKEEYTTFTTDLTDTGYNFAEPPVENDILLQQDIPEIPGLENSEDSDALYDIPIIGSLDMSVTSSTGGYFVQKGSWKEAGDVYTLVCGHATQPVFGVGTMKDRYKGAKETKELMDKAAAGDEKGVADLKQKRARNIEIYPVFYLKFTVVTAAEPTAENADNLEHYLTGFEAALGLDAFVRQNVPFMAGPVPMYVFFTITSEAYLQVQSTMPGTTKLGEEIEGFSFDNAETNVFFNAPVMDFGAKGGVGYNFTASVYAEGMINTPFILEFTPFNYGGNIMFDIGIGVELVGFAIELEYELDNPITYGNQELFNELKTIAEQQEETGPVARYRASNGGKYPSIAEVLKEATFSVMERPKQEQAVLRAGRMDSKKLAENVFMNTKVKLAELSDGKIMALFLTDNQTEEGNLNYLSVAYTISNDNGKTWSDIKYVSENISEENSSYQYNINVFELDDSILVTWSEADINEMLKDADPENVTASQLAKAMDAMNLKGRFFDKSSGEPLSEAVMIAGNSTVFCAGLDAVQNGDDIHVYYQRNALPTGDDVTAADLLESERTIALATADKNQLDNWTSVPVRAETENGREYRIVDVVPFVHDGILGEIFVLDRNGRISLYNEKTQEMESDIDDWQLYLRTYKFDEEGDIETTAFISITASDVCAKNPEVLSTENQLYLLWNQDGNIVYTSDFVARDTDSEAALQSAYVVANSDGTYTVQTPDDAGAATIANDETLYIGTKFTASMSEDGNILISWVASDKEDETLVPTDEIYGAMLAMTETGLHAKGSPVALTDGDSPIGALDSICMEDTEATEFLLVYSELDAMLRRDSKSADVLSQVNEESVELKVDAEVPEYPLPGNTITAEITVKNEGLEPLNGYKIKVSGVGDAITLTHEATGEKTEEGHGINVILPGRSVRVPVEIEVPEDFDKTTMLEIEVSGIGNQKNDVATVEKEVLYESYFVPMDIPEVESVPNSTDCLVTTAVRNNGNAPGKVSMYLINRIFATNEKDGVKEYRFESDEMITPGGEATYCYLMEDTFMSDEVYSTVQVWTGDGYDQGTEAPMTKPVTVSAENVSTDNGEEEKPDIPGTPDDSNKPEDMENSNESDAVNTGDHSNIGIYFILLVGAFLGMTRSIAYRRKQK